jgi:hypothetical protein
MELEAESKVSGTDVSRKDLRERELFIGSVVDDKLGVVFELLCQNASSGFST